MDPTTRKAIEPPWRTLEANGYQVRAMTWAEHRALSRGDTLAWCHAVRTPDGQPLLDREEQLSQDEAKTLLEAVLESPEPTVQDRRLWRNAPVDMQMAMHWRLGYEEVSHAERLYALVEAFVRSSLKLPALALPWKLAALNRLARTEDDK